MIRRPPRSTRTDTLFPYTTLFRSSIFPKISMARWSKCNSSLFCVPRPSSKRWTNSSLRSTAIAKLHAKSLQQRPACLKAVPKIKPSRRAEQGLSEVEYLSKLPRLASIRHFDQFNGYSGQAGAAFPDENDRYAQQKDRGLQGYRLPSRHRLPHEGGTGDRKSTRLNFSH